MTITELVTYFELLQDKYGSPYFTTAEKELFLNQAQLNIIATYFPKKGDSENIEKNANTWMAFNPLFFSNATSMNGSGVITKADVETAVSSAEGFTVTILRPLSIMWADADGVRPVSGPVRQNNWAKYQDNIFKIATEQDPKYYETNTSYVISPANTGVSITINGLRYPKSISVSGTQTAEIAPVYHSEIVARALEMAGVGSRDEMLVQLNKLTKE